MTASDCEQPRSGDIGESRGQQVRIIQRLGSPKTHAVLLGELLEANIDVVENFHVVAEKSYGLKKYPAMSFFFQAENRIFHAGPQPRSTGHALALKRKLPVFRSQRSLARHQCRRFLGLTLVGSPSVMVRSGTLCAVKMIGIFRGPSRGTRDPIPPEAFLRKL